MLFFLPRSPSEPQVYDVPGSSAVMCLIQYKLRANFLFLIFCLSYCNYYFSFLPFHHTYVSVILSCTHPHFNLMCFINSLVQNAGGSTLKQSKVFKNVSPWPCFLIHSVLSKHSTQAPLYFSCQLKSFHLGLVSFCLCALWLTAVLKFLGCKWDCHAWEIRRQLTANIDFVFKAFHEAFERQW